MVSFVQIDLNQTKSKIVYETKPQSYPLPTIKAMGRPAHLSNLEGEGIFSVYSIKIQIQIRFRSDSDHVEF